MGARNRVGIGLSYRPAGLHRLAEFIPWNRFLGPVNVINTGSGIFFKKRRSLGFGVFIVIWSMPCSEADTGDAECRCYTHTVHPLILCHNFTHNIRVSFLKSDELLYVDVVEDLSNPSSYQQLVV
jgi:hypothetical protein